MILKYNVAMEDIVAFNRYHLERSPALRTINRLFAVLIAILAFGLAFIIDPGEEISRWWIVGGAAVCVVLYVLLNKPVFNFMLNWFVPRMVNEASTTKGLLGAHELEIDANGVVERTDVNESRSSWLGIEKIEETDEHAFIYMSTLAAHVSPKRSISEGDVNQFIATARESWRIARPGT